VPTRKRKKKKKLRKTSKFVNARSNNGSEREGS
jgi:hypothetical protein